MTFSFSRSVQLVLFTLLSPLLFAAEPVYADPSAVDPASLEALSQVLAHVSPNTEFKAQTVDELPSDVRSRLQAIAKSQAQLWGDTILEGDYSAASDTRLDGVESVFQNDRLIAYRIVYSETAWYTGECDPEQSMKLCQPGRISERTYVSPGLDKWVQDEAAGDDFVAKN